MTRRSVRNQGLPGHLELICGTRGGGLQVQVHRFANSIPLHNQKSSRPESNTHTGQELPSAPRSADERVYRPAQGEGAGHLVPNPIWAMIGSPTKVLS